MRKIIHDCDCTFGINGCDVDDGLALLYLLGDPEAEVLGVTTTYGNNTLEKVYENTKKFVKSGMTSCAFTKVEQHLEKPKVKRHIILPRWQKNMPGSWKFW